MYVFRDMQVIVLATEAQKTAFDGANNTILWVENVHALTRYASASAFVDLTFEPDEERLAVLAGLLPKPVIINSVVATVQETNTSFIRINGWNTFLSSPLWEASCLDEEMKQKGEAVFSLLGKRAEWLPDRPGFVTARVVSMIINEAYLALEEGVSTKDEINTAMKLGTAYPYGPFEWAQQIGRQKVVSLLQKLRQLHPRYTPAGLLVSETTMPT